MPTKPTTPSDLPAKVLECVKLYTDTRISRENLAAFCHASDRQVRDAIKQLRDEGHPIVSGSGNAGYYYDPSRIDEVIADMESRIQKMSETVKALRHGHQAECRQLELAV